jgi:hypothetical protein
LLEQLWPPGQPLRPGAGEQPLVHLCVPESQIRPESAPPQSESDVQPQTPPFMHAWPSTLVVHRPGSLGPHFWHDPSVVHTGAEVGQSESPRQATQWPACGSQIGVVPVQWVVSLAEHSPHEPEPAQTGEVVPQSVSLAQPRQVWVVPSQTGVAVGQSASVRQPTQTPAAASQNGVAPVQAVELVAVH